MRKRWMLFILLVLSLSLFALTTHAQEATAEPTTEATAALQAPTAEATPALEAPTAEVTAEATAVLEPVPPTEAPASENPGRTEGAPTGLSTLVLLMGLGAVSIVGLAILARENLQNRNSNKS